MADESKGNPVPPGQADASLLDKTGVPWKNRAKEAERKADKWKDRTRTLEARLDALEKRVSPNPIPTSNPVPAPVTDPKVIEAEQRRLQEIQNLATNPEGYVMEKLFRAKMAEEAMQAQNWVQSQEDYKPELEPELVRVIKEHGLQSRPLQRAKDAMKLLKEEKPQLFPRSKQVNSRDETLSKYQTLGPGRLAPPENTDERKQLLENFRKVGQSGSLQEQADALAALTHNYFTKGNK